MHTQVKARYMENADLLQHRAVITKVGMSEINKKHYHWIELDETIFHPKGGGQLSDDGTVGGHEVAYVHKEMADKSKVDQFAILHCFDKEIPFKEGDSVELIVDGVKRALYSKWHTSGHVIAQVVNELFPELEAFHGNHDPQNGYVRFKLLLDIAYGKVEMLAQIFPALQIRLEQDLPVKITRTSSGVRMIQIGRQEMPCGGTHVRHLSEIGKVEITDVSINKKDKVVTVKYQLWN